MNLSIFNIDVDLLIFLAMYLICASQLNLLLSITPRNLVSLVSFIICPLTLIDIVGGRSRLVNTIICVLIKLIISLLAANHSRTNLKSSSAVFMTCPSVFAL